MDINEIARRAGVSRATVSRYLNNGYVSKEKRELISRIIEETGYIPSRQAQQLRTGKTHLVGVIIPKINSQSVSRMVAGITDELNKSNYHVLLANTNNDELAEVRFLKVFAERNRVDGIILMATVFTEEHRKAIKKLRIPLVVLGQNIDGYSCVYQDDFCAVAEITRLVLRKAKTVAYLGVREQDVAAGEMRHKGFLHACAKQGFHVAPEAQLEVGFDADAGYFGAEKLLDTVPDLDTIVCATDDIAFGAMMCMREYGKAVPEDVQITGVGDSLLSQIVHPSLTTAHLYYKTGGVEAAKLLLEHLSSKKTEIRHLRMSHEVYGRNSMR